MANLVSRSQQLLEFIHHCDVRTFSWCMARKHLLPMVRLSRIISRTADGFGYPVLALALLWFGGAAQEKTFFLAMVVGFALERPLYFLLKKGLKRNRPAQVVAQFNSFIIPSDQFSFPSGHTSGAFLVATLLIWLFPMLWAPLYLWAVLVGASRVVLGVHFPTDILAGTLMGTSIAYLALAWVS